MGADSSFLNDMRMLPPFSRWSLRGSFFHCRGGGERFDEGTSVACILRRIMWKGQEVVLFQYLESLPDEVMRLVLSMKGRR